MRHRLTLGMMFLALYSSSACAFIRAPATRPAQAPAATAAEAKPLPPTPGDLKNITRLIAGLADEHYEIREESRVALMGLKRADLGNLQLAVKQSLPLEPSQVAVLRDIVTQVYLSGESYAMTDEELGFLGISMANGNREEDLGLLSIERGIAIISRVPGFCAYRMLQTGDVILAMTSPVRVEFKSADPNDLFMRTVKGMGAGQTLMFEVLRQGRIINVTLTLDRRPAGLENLGFIQEFTAARADKAEAYWKKEFLPMLSDLIG